MNETTSPLTFKESIQLGKYDETYLSQYQEWVDMDDHLRFQFISQALQNRRRQLRIQWANLANQMDFSKKPYLTEAQQKVEQALRDLSDDEEKLMVKYAGM